MEARLFRLNLFKDRMQRTAKHFGLRQGLADTVGEYKSRTVAYERLEQISQASADVNLSEGVSGLGYLNITFPARLLNREWSGSPGKVFCFKPKCFTYPETRASQQGIQNLLLPNRFLNDGGSRSLV